MVASLGLKVADKVLNVVGAGTWVTDFSVLIHWSSRSAHEVTLELLSVFEVLTRRWSLELRYLNLVAHGEPGRPRLQLLYAIVTIRRGTRQPANRARVLGVTPLTHSGLASSLVFGGLGSAALWAQHVHNRTAHLRQQTSIVRA